MNTDALVTTSIEVRQSSPNSGSDFELDFLSTDRIVSNMQKTSHTVVDKTNEISVTNVEFNRVKVIQPLIDSKSSPAVFKERFTVIQEWEGAVDEVFEEFFTAYLRDLTGNEKHAGEVAELPIDDVSNDDRMLLRPGAVFFLTIGRVTRINGQVERTAQIVFRRLPAWTATQLDRATQQAESLSSFLSQES